MSETDAARQSDVQSSGPETATMRLRAEAPRVTRISRRVLAGVGLVAGIARFRSTAPDRHGDHRSEGGRHPQPILAGVSV